MSIAPRSTATPSNSRIAAASRAAIGAPRVRMPTRISRPGSGWRSTNSCAMRGQRPPNRARVHHHRGVGRRRHRPASPWSRGVAAKRANGEAEMCRAEVCRGADWPMLSSFPASRDRIKVRAAVVVAQPITGRRRPTPLFCRRVFPSTRRTRPERPAMASPQFGALERKPPTRLLAIRGHRLHAVGCRRRQPPAARRRHRPRSGVGVTRSKSRLGPTRADIVCRSIPDEHQVVIENQLERTDHDHLGKLLTYAAGLSDVSTVVWIAREFTEQHRAALDWLNRSTTEGRSLLRHRDRGLADRGFAPRTPVQRSFRNPTSGPRPSPSQSLTSLVRKRNLRIWTAFSKAWRGRNRHRSLRQEAATGQLDVLRYRTDWDQSIGCGGACGSGWT